MLLGFLSRIAGMVLAAGLLGFGLHGYLALAGRVTPNASLLAGCAMAVVVGGLLWRGIERRIAARLEQAEADALRPVATLGSYQVDARNSAAMWVLIGVFVMFAVAAGIAARAGNFGALSGYGALALMLGWILAVILQLRRRPGPMLAMDARELRHAQFAPIPWRDVIGLQFLLVERHGQHQGSLLLGVRAPARFIAPTPWLVKAAYGYRRWRISPPAYGKLVIPLQGLAAPPQEVHAHALAFRKQVDAPFIEHWHDGMTAQEIDTAFAMDALLEKMDRLEPGRSPEAELESLNREMLALAPRMRECTQLALARQRRTVRNAWLLLAATVAGSVLVLWLKISG